MAIDAVNNSNSLASYQGSPKAYNQKDSISLTEHNGPKENAGINIQEPKGNITEDTLQQPAQESEQLKKAVESLNKKMANSEALFGMHEETNRIIIKIVDKETKEVIKELPPEKTLDMIAKAWEMAGLLVDEKR